MNGAVLAVSFRPYQDEDDLEKVRSLVDLELSEPYSVFTYRYFIHKWPHLCFLAFSGERCIGAVVCKLDSHYGTQRGYVASMLWRYHTLLPHQLSQCWLWTRPFESSGPVRSTDTFVSRVNSVLQVQSWFALLLVPCVTTKQTR